MNDLYDLEKSFEYENGFYATADPSRFSKFISHLEFFKRTSEVRGEIVEFGIFKGNSFFRWIKFRDFSARSRKFDNFIKTIEDRIKKTTYSQWSIMK